MLVRCTADVLYSVELIFLIEKLRFTDKWYNNRELLIRSTYSTNKTNFTIIYMIPTDRFFCKFSRLLSNDNYFIKMIYKYLCEHNTYEPLECYGAKTLVTLLNVYMTRLTTVFSTNCLFFFCYELSSWTVSVQCLQSPFELTFMLTNEC